MAKYCTNCGHELRDTDKFCAECATPVGQPATSCHAPAYETCEIKWRPTLRWPIYKFAFYAEAIGPKGVYEAGRSKDVTNKASPNGGLLGASARQSEPVVRALITQLTAQGWEPVSEKGTDWYSYRFRRPVKG